MSVSSAQDWIPFRDVFEVDAQPIRDREQRLARLFLKPSEDSLEQAYRIQDESARYNLGNMRRTINNPVLAMVVVQAEFQNRFRYSLGKMDPKVGPGVWIVDYHEEARRRSSGADRISTCSRTAAFGSKPKRDES